jgi:hypothetical protein
MPKISYTDKVAPVQPDGTVAAFKVRDITKIQIFDNNSEEEEGDPLKKLKRKKIDALKVTLSLIVGNDPSYPFMDVIRLQQGWMGKFDGLRIATGEVIASREDYDTDELIGKDGMLVLTEKDGTNFVQKYLSPEE